MSMSVFGVVYEVGNEGTGNEMFTHHMHSLMVILMCVNLLLLRYHPVFGGSIHS